MNPIEECHVCGGDAHLVRDPMEILIGHRAAMVPAARMRCELCGAEFFLPGQMDDAQRLAASQMRAEEGLLDPQDIKSIRQRYGLTQPQLEKLLGVGPKTVVRWEKGTVFQNAATDALLRIVRDVPDAAEYLAAQRGMALPTAAEQEESPAASIAPEQWATFNFDSILEPQLESSNPADDPKIVSLDSYRTKRSLVPIPPDMLKKAQL